MQGIGNDFIVVDALSSDYAPANPSAFARKVNDRRFGVGGDGLVILDRGAEAPFRMRMFNPDGSESEMCGNAVRCIARLIRERGYSDAEQIPIETGSGLLRLETTSSGSVRVDMGPAILAMGQIPMVGDPAQSFIDQPIEGYRATAVSMGNPHLVIFVDDVNNVDLEILGARFETHRLFPNRINVHFAQVMDRSSIVQRTWERGAGVTLACGTGACAVGVAAKITGRADSPIDIRLPGGHLQIEVDADLRVHMTGPAETVFEGVWPDATA
jgi:diaminopimelate epimerase